MLIMIAAVGKNNELGKNGQLIWKFSKDMNFFREKTKNAVVVMGRKTFNSLPKILPNRRHIVLSKGKEFNKEVDENVTVIEDKTELISYCRELSLKKDVFIIGGESLYTMFMDIADRMYLTRIEAEDSMADVFFPKVEESNWESKTLSWQEENGIRFCFVEYNHKRF